MPLHPQPDRPADLIAAVLASSAADLEEAAAGLVRLFGPLRTRGPAYDFAAFTRYYEGEMGPGLVKQLLWFENQMPPDRLAAIKVKTMALELELARLEGGVRRRANIDPGLVSSDSLVLATTKASGHRVCIAPGLFAEITLLYERDAYRPMPWTYRDFRTEDAQGFLQQIRERLLMQRAPR